MKLIKKQNESITESPIISSDDIYMTGETTGSNLSEIINDHEKDINDLKKYTKWLYKYGGTGSKGGSGGGGGGSAQQTMTATVIFNGTPLKENRSQQIVLNGETSVSISGNISGTISTNNYYISIKKVTGSQSIYLTTKAGIRNGVGYDKVTADDWYQFNYSTGIDTDTSFVITVLCQGSENKTLTYTVDVVKEAYSFSLSFVDANHNQIVSADNDLWIDGNASVRNSGLLLNINYNVIADNPIEYEIIGDEVSKMFDTGVINGLINENAIRRESFYIPFKQSFLDDDDSIGYYSITVGFTIKESGQAIQTIYKDISFNLIPQSTYFFKVIPYNQKQKFYKYNENNISTIESNYNEFDTLYQAYLTFVVHNDILENKQDIINLIRSKYNEEISDAISDDDLKEEIQNAVAIFENNIYVYQTGTIRFYVTAYYGSDTSRSISIEAELNDERIDIGMSQIQLRNKETISLNIANNGIYKFSFYCPDDTSRKLTYYMYVYNKVTEIDWYSEDVSISAQNYWRNGNTTQLFNKYKNTYFIQKYNNDTGKTNVISITSQAGSTINSIGYPNAVNDIMMSFGIQYSANNTSTSSPIIEILAQSSVSDSSTNKNNIFIYQNKVTTNGNDMRIFLPKEELYNVKDDSKYHLLTLYKRYIYTKDNKDYYEFCIYLDGCLENACDTFISDNPPMVTINLLPSNFAINLVELTYFNHNGESIDGIEKYNLPRVSSDGTVNQISYLDDVAISEYYYKYAGVINKSLDIPHYEMVKKIINSLRGFGEVSNGLIKVGGEAVINDIAKEGTVPVMLFEHTDESLGQFVRFYTSTQAEGTSDQLKLNSLKYSQGGEDLKQILMPSISGIGNLDQSCYWYIEIQGSSTKLNFAKNLNVGIYQGQPGYMLLFTPNFKYVDFSDSSISAEEKIQAKNTYLPETKFTLKTDQVDSTHSNNTAVGAFVNANTTPFISTSDANNNYSNYIKNCLLGFPVLVFIKVINYAGPNVSGDTVYYFLGIMNFNLGRDSYFNMGYYDTRVLQNNDDCHNALQATGESPFKTVYVTTGDASKTELEIQKEVIVAEIQGNDNHFDFSQADNSVLFPNNPGDNHVMFGDFVPKYTYGSESDNKMQAHLHRLVENVSLSGGYLFNMIGKHFGEYKKGYNAYINDGENTSIFASANQVPNYMIQYERIPGKGDNGEPLYSVKTIRPNRSEAECQEDLRNLILNYEDDSGEVHNPILDYKSVSEYYVICMGFGLVDSVMKNLNVKTWNASQNIEADKISGKWFATFYDMDTAFGTNNGGTPTKYFAFSDYWFNSSSALSPATIYRDFYPKTEDSGEKVANIGYDVPSSYLFAIAKYAPLAFRQDTDDDLFSVFRQSTPQNIWARWRTTNPETKSKLGSIGLGELKNANYFIDKYFIRNLDEIPEQIWNMNYRLKYLKRIAVNTNSENGDFYTYDTETDSYETELNKKPFHGKGINELREWLAGRLHILDAYFNIEGCGKRDQYQILKLNYNDTEESNLPADLEDTNHLRIEVDPESGATYKFWEDKLTPLKRTSGEYDWVNSGYEDNVPDATIEQLYGNEDIILLSDIFSGTRQGNKYDNNIYLKFKSKEYSPILVVNAMGAYKKYLIENPNNVYNIQVYKTGTTNSMFGGSANWTWIENLNSLISEGIYVNSKNLESFVLTQGKCSKYTIIAPALKEVSITQPKENENNYTEFSGSLSFSVDGGNDKFPCLDKIDISRTSIQLTVNGEGVKTINLSNIYSSAISITNCNNLSSVNLAGAAINNCEINPGWSNQISISSSRINTLKLGAKDKTSDGNRYFTINSDSALSTLELDGFTHIEISDCSKLNNLTLKDVQNIKSLKIIRCNTPNAGETVSPIKFTMLNGGNSMYKEDGELPLQFFTNLEEISLDGTYGIKTLDFTNCAGATYIDKDGNEWHGINLPSYAFRSTDVETIITNNASSSNNPREGQVLFINGPAIFSDSNYAYGDNALYIKKSVTSLSGLFNYSFSASNITGKEQKITNIMASEILNNSHIADYQKTVYEDISSITDISNMFFGQTKISVGDKSSEYSQQIHQLSLCNFSNVNNISGIYGYCNIHTVTSDLFASGDNILGKNSESINIISFIIMTQVNFELNSLQYIIDKVSTLIAYETLGMTIDLFRASSITDTDFKLQDFFKVNDNGSLVNISLPKLTAFTGFNIKNNLDWTDAFIYMKNGERTFMFPNLTTVVNSFNRTDVNNVNLNSNIDKWGLDKHNKVISVPDTTSAFNFSLATPIDYKKVIDVNLYGGLVPSTNSAFVMPKYIMQNDFIDVLKTANDNSITNLDYKFQYIHILKDNGDNVFKTHNETVTQSYSFTSCKHTFENMKFRQYSVEDDEIILGIEVPIVLSSNSLKMFTNCLYWDYAFSNITMGKNLPLNLFNKQNGTTENGRISYLPSNYVKNIQSLEGTFTKVKIASSQTYFAHEEYSDICIEGTQKLDVNKYNNGDELHGSYHSEILISGLMAGSENVMVDNPKSKNIEMDIEGNIISYGKDIVNHLILPFDIFYGCSIAANVKSCFASSDFEGILPSKLLANNVQSPINRTLYNLLVIPNRIYNYAGDDFIYYENELLFGTSEGMQSKIEGILNINDAGISNSNLKLYYDALRKRPLYQRHETYVFVPRYFITNTALNESFNFKLILPLSVANKPNEATDNPHNSLYEQYFVFTNKSISDGSLISMTNTLPGAGQAAQNGEFNGGTYDLYYINTGHPYNANQTDTPNQLNSRAYHNIHYSLLLIEPESSDTYGKQDAQGNDAETLTYNIISQLAQDNSNIEDIMERYEYIATSSLRNYGISYLHYGMTLTGNLRQNKLSGFMGMLILRFLFGSIFKFNIVESTPTLLNIIDSDTGSYSSIFGGVEVISKYCQLPLQHTYYSNAIYVNTQYNVQISEFNCGGYGDSESYNNYTNPDKYNNINPYSKDLE